MKTTRTKDRQISIIVIALVALLGAMTETQAATITSTGSGNWNSTTAGAPWPGGTVPALSDTVIIANGSTVTMTDNRTLTGPVTVNSGGVLNVSATVAFNYGSGTGLTVASGGILNNSSIASVGFGSGTGTSCGGTITNNAGATFTTSGNITIAGMFDNLGTATVADVGGGAGLIGAGTFKNDTGSTLNIASGGAAPAAALLNLTAAGNTVNFTTSGKTATATTYVNLGLIGGSGMSAAGSTVTGNLTVSGTTTVANNAWPTSPVGTVIYSSSGTTTTFPAALSIGGLNQSAGTMTLPANAVLTVTGTGAGIWTRSAGTFTANATSTVKFTGAAPDIGGAVATAFGKLLIDSTATTATASGTAFTVATALTINPSGQLDLSALSGSSLTLGASASLTNSGTIKGSLVTGATGKVFAGTDGGYDTSTIALTPTTGDLTLTSGSTVNLDVNSTAAAANDKLVVGGTLTLNSTVFNLKAPSNGATIDTADYTLATASTVSGTPVLHWVTGFVPANSGNYVLVVSGGTITLHDTAVAPASSPTITITSSGGVLTLSWDSTTFPGYSVQAQTNSASAGLGANWSDTGSGTVSPYTPTIDPANPTVFYRLIHP